MKNEVEESKKERLTRYGDKDVLTKIAQGLPADQQEHFVKYRHLWQETDRNRIDLEFPLNIYIEPVSGCNLKCAFCVRSRTSWRQHAPNLFSGKHLGMESFQQIIDEGTLYNLPAIWVGASGEAFLEKDLCQMLLYAHDKGIMDNILITNGSLLTHSIVDQLLDIPITRLNVSIDAFSESTYSKIRGADYQKLHDNLDYFLSQRKKLNALLPVLRVTFVETDINIHERNDFIEYWQQRAETVDVQKYYDFDLTPPKDAARDISCSFPWRSIMILGNGDVLPCCSFYAARDLVMGNIHEASIKAIWDGKLFQQHRLNLKQGTYADACKQCFDSVYG